MDQNNHSNDTPQNKPATHVVFNAMSLRPGGGLTVLAGLIDGLLSQADTEYRISVICSADDTHAAVVRQQQADQVYMVCQNQGIIKRHFWTMLSMPKMVKQLKPDLFVSVNQYIAGIACPQVIYHLNLLRFMPIEPGASFMHRIKEKVRNQTSLKALKHGSANVFESDYLRQCAREIYSGNSTSDQVIYVGMPKQCSELPELDAGDINRGQIISLTNQNEYKDNRTLLKMLAELAERPSRC